MHLSEKCRNFIQYKKTVLYYFATKGESEEEWISYSCIGHTGHLFNVSSGVIILTLSGK